MDRPMNAWTFRFMVVLFKIRDAIRPRTPVIDEAKLLPGMKVLDFGCGTGSYVPLAARLVGPGGTVYAVDIHPMAVKRVEKIAASLGLQNLKTIQTDCETGLDSASIDVVLMHDIFHLLKDPQSILRELHRVLKPEGTVSFSDHHMKDEDILSRLREGDLFSLKEKGTRTFRFARR